MANSDSICAASSLLSGHADQRYVSIGILAKQCGLSRQVLRDYERKGVLVDSVVRSIGGHRRYLLQTALQQIFNLQNKADEVTSGNGRPIAYARVSGSAQSKGFDHNKNDTRTGTQSDLLRQVNRLKSYSVEHYGVEPILYSDTGSGMHDGRKSFCKLIFNILDGRHRDSILLISFRERLIRFNYNLLERIFEWGGVRIEILDSDEKEEQDLSVEIGQDVVAILGHFHARVNGAKAARTNTKKLAPITIEAAVKLHQQGIAWWGIVEKLKSAGHRTLNGDTISYHVLKRNVAANIKELVPVVGDDENTNSFGQWATKFIRPKRGGHLRLAVIHTSYSKWCEANNIEALTARRCSFVLRKEMGLESSNKWDGYTEIVGVEIVNG